MKYLLHIPTEQYGFISAEIERVEEEGTYAGRIATPHDAVEAYKAVQEAFKGGAGVSSKDFNAFLDTYISTGKPGELEVWEQMTDQQKIVINEVKKCFSRIKSKQ